jgi:hypothetical protein
MFQHGDDFRFEEESALERRSRLRHDNPADPERRSKTSEARTVCGGARKNPRPLEVADEVMRFAD